MSPPSPSTAHVSERVARGSSATSPCAQRTAKILELWTDVPQPSDRIGGYTTEQLEQMNQEFTAAVERAFRSGDESEMAAAATYDLRRR
jgi:hypothetical protein